MPVSGRDSPHRNHFNDLNSCERIGEDKMFVTKNGLVLTAAVVAVAMGMGCARKDDAKFANAKVAVSTQAIQSDINSIQLTISDAATPGPGFPIVSLLTKAPAGNVWTGNVSNIPAAPAP